MACIRSQAKIDVVNLSARPALVNDWLLSDLACVNFCKFSGFLREKPDRNPRTGAGTGFAEYLSHHGIKQQPAVHKLKPKQTQRRSSPKEQKMTFKPNALTFHQGLLRINDAFKKSGVNPPQNIVTSRDPHIATVAAHLKVSNVPNGFSKWQLPVHLDGPSQLFISVGAPDTEVPTHSHNEGDGIRIIMSGSIIYDGVELTAGDWMYVPKGKAYKFKVGARGVTQCYCYQCCCA